MSFLWYSVILSFAWAAVASSLQEVDWKARNLATIEKIYNLTVYPANKPIVDKGEIAVPPGLFAKNVVGRVTPVGNFTDFTESIEYFFGLAPTPDSNLPGIAFHKAEVSEFTSGCPEIAASVVNLRTGKFVNGTHVPGTKYETTLKQFNDKGEVVAYDAWIPNLQRWTTIANGIDFNSKLVGMGIPIGICPEIQKRCKDGNQQFTSSPDCIMKLQAKPTGDFNEAWGDNLVCRLIHLQLTLVRPEIHCPHVGPNGGSPPKNFKCVNTTYDDSYTDDVALFGSKNPFKCEEC
ncbi:hypothetical protein FKW77_000561 [Venturia effusa]|uniref:Uncharacterized protein n=1 Tax=Venturia effusa TaxID=50376 RepID=A0A517KYX0_9PEZI|nr:hypothetical protein FKW77_000561 [Venturia effusa]